MSNPFQKADPWGESSFENLTNQTQKAATTVKKAVSDTAAAVATDVKQQVSGDYGVAMEQGNQGQTANPGQSAQQAAEQEKAKKELLNQTRLNLEKINMDIKRVREERLKKEEEKKKAEEKKKEQKKQVEQKKKQEDPLWKKMLQGKKGSREVAKGVSG